MTISQRPQLALPFFCPEVQRPVLHVIQLSLALQEHFKECEKEAKMKPFAKAALAAGYTEKLDPSLEAKAEAQRWLKNAVSGLAEQVERFEVHVACATVARCQCPSLTDVSIH